MAAELFAKFKKQAAHRMASAMASAMGTTMESATQTALKTTRAAVMGIALTGLSMGAASNAQAADKTVVVYTPLKADAVRALLQKFTAETGVKVSMVAANTGTLLNRVKAEAQHPNGDVLLSLGGANLQAAQDLLDPYTPPNASKIRPEFKVDAAWTPFSAATVVVEINTKEVPPGERPTSWQDLTNPKWKGKIATTQADLSGNAFQALATVLATQPTEQQGWALYTGLMKNFQYANSAGAVARLVNDGEYPIGVLLEDNALDYVRASGPVTIMYPKDGTSVVPDGMAIVKGAPDQAEAKTLENWVLSDNGQRAITQLLSRRPVTDIDASPAGTAPLASIKRVPFDVAHVGDQTASWVKKWRSLNDSLQ